MEEQQVKEKQEKPLGILDVLGSGSGFIRRSEAGYTPSKEDIYVCTYASFKKIANNVDRKNTFLICDECAAQVSKLITIKIKNFF